MLVKVASGIEREEQKPIQEDIPEGYSTNY
jgi:hypothetical protein